MFQHRASTPNTGFLDKITAMAVPRWYHGSNEEWSPGDQVLTAAQAGRPTRGGPGDEHRVWVSSDPYRAGSYGASIYEVTPADEPRRTRGPADEHDTSGATVVRKVPYQEAAALSPSYQEQARAYARANGLRYEAALLGHFEAADADYRVQHQGPDADDGEAMHEVGSGKVYPTDIHQHPDWYIEADGPGNWDSWDKVRKSKDWPSRRVTMYRSLPSPHREVNTGDWVTSSPAYAREHGRQSNSADDWPVVKFEARADQLRTAGDSINEWSYHGPPVSRALVHFSGGANHRGKGPRGGKADALLHEHEPPEMNAEYNRQNTERRQRLRAEREQREAAVQHHGAGETAPEGHQVWAEPHPDQVSPVAAEVRHNMMTREPADEHGSNWYHGVSYHGPYHVIRHPQTRQVWVVDRHGRDASPTGGHYGNPERDGNWGEHQAWQHQHGLESAGPEAHRFGTPDDPKLNLMNERVPEFPHSRVDPEDEERVRRPEPRVHAPEGVSPSDEYHGSYEVVRHPETSRYHVVDNAGRSAHVLPLNGFGTQLQAERSRDYTEKRQRSKEIGRGIANSIWEGGSDVLDPGGTAESRQSDENIRSSNELMTRYHGGKGQFKFEPDEEGGAPYYEREHHHASGKPSGWYVKHKGSAPRADVYHRATGDEAHDTMWMGEDEHGNLPDAYGEHDLEHDLREWHDRPDGMRRHLEEDRPEYGGNARIQRWKRQHLGSVPDVVAHFEAPAGEDELPPDPGTAPVPEGHVRLWHYTPQRNIASIREHGLLRSKARSDVGNGDLSEPSAGVWASTDRPHDIMDHSYGGAGVVEFHAHPDEISGNAESPWRAMNKDRTYDQGKLREWNEGRHHVIMRGDVPPEHILAVHEPWHHAARYMRDTDPTLAEFQWVKGEPDEDTSFEPYKRGLRALERGHQREASAAVLGATNWDQSYDEIPAEVHRGLYAPQSHQVFAVPMSDEDVAHSLIAAHQEEQFPHERGRHELFGTHWSASEDVARGFAKEHEQAHHDEYDDHDHEDHSEATPVVFHAQRPERHEIEDDPRRLGWQNVDDHDHPEREVPIRHGAPVRITGVSWLKHTGFGPIWHRHDLSEPVQLRAEDRDSPDDPGEWNDDGHQKEASMAVFAALANPNNEAGVKAFGRHWSAEDTPETWYHGSPYAYHHMDPGQAADQESLMDEPSHTHWNNLLGSHFAAAEGTAANFVHSSSSGNYEGDRSPGYIYHARLHIRNPGHYDSEFDMDREAYGHEFDQGNHPVNHDDFFEEEHEGDPSLGHHEDLRSQPETLEVPDRITGGTKHVDNRPRYMRWLSVHPDKVGIARRFKDRLEAAGHDGITYGNELEENNGARGGTSAIAFHPHQVQVTQRHEYDPRCDTEYERAGNPYNCKHGEEAHWEEGHWPSHDQPELPFGEHEAAVVAHFEEEPLPGYHGEPLYHGTRSILEPGEHLTVEEAGRHANNADIQTDPYVHATTDPREAHRWGERANAYQAQHRMTELGRERSIGPGQNAAHAYRPRVYEVHPTGPVEPDLEYADTEHDSWRSAHPVRVGREVEPLQCPECPDTGRNEEHWPDHPHYDYLRQQADEDDADREERGYTAALTGGPDQLSAREERGDRWHEYRNQASGHLHRGIIVTLPDDLDAHVHDEGIPREQRAAALQQHFADSGEGLGTHWTPHPQIAQRAISNAASGDEAGQGAYSGHHAWDSDDDDNYDEGEDGGDGGQRTEVMFHVRRPGERNRLPQREHEQYGIGWSHSPDEDEFPLRPGSPLRLAGISWKRHDPQYPNEPFEHHDFDRPVRHVSSVIPAQEALPAVVAHFGPPGHFDFYHGEGSQDGRPRTTELEEHLYAGGHGRPSWDASLDEAIPRAQHEAYAGEGTNTQKRARYHQALEGMHQREHDDAASRAQASVEGGADPFYPHARRAELERGHHQQWQDEQGEHDRHQEEVREHLENGQAHMHGQDVSFGEMTHHLRSVHGIPHDALPEHQLPASSYHDPYQGALEEAHEQHHGDHTLPETGSYRHTPHGQYVTMHWGPRTDFDAEHHLVEHHGFNIDELRHEEPDLEAEHERDHADNRSNLTHHRYTVMDPDNHLPEHGEFYQGPDAEELREGDPEHHFEVRSRDDEGSEHSGVYHAEDEDHAREMHEDAHPYDEEAHHVGRAPVVPPRRQYTMPAGHADWEPTMGPLQPPSEHGTDAGTASSWRHVPYAAPPRTREALEAHIREGHGSSAAGHGGSASELHARMHDSGQPDHQHDLPEGHDPVLGSRDPDVDDHDWSDAALWAPDRENGRIDCLRHLRDQHGLLLHNKMSLEGLENIHDAKHAAYGERAHHVIRALSPEAMGDQAYRYRLPGDPGFESREASALVAHFAQPAITLIPVYDAALPAVLTPLDAVTGALRSLGAWEPQGNEDAVTTARALPEVFLALRDGLAAVSAALSEMPVHPAVRDAVAELAAQAGRASQDADDLVRRLPPEASWQESGPPNR